MGYSVRGLFGTDILEEIFQDKVVSFSVPGVCVDVSGGGISVVVPGDGVYVGAGGVSQVTKEILSQHRNLIS